MENKPTYTLYRLTFYFLKLGTFGFGGPVALVGYMHRDLVEKRKWISEDEYKEGLALSQLAPGPLAAQLAIYLGYVHYQITGATLVGIAFVLPSLIIVIALGFAYTMLDGLPWMQSVFYGVGAAVIGIISVSSYKMVRKSVRDNALFWGIVIVVAVTTFLTEREIIWMIILAGVLVWFIQEPPAFLKTKFFFTTAPLLLLATTANSTASKLEQMGWFFLKAGAFVFGSGLAIVPFLYGGVVKENQWLNEQQFLDAVAVAMITPGPVVITVAFIGYLVAGLPGALIAAMATFLPCYLFTVLPAPYFKKYGKNPAIKAFIDGVTVAAIGAIAGAVGILAIRQFTDALSILIALSTILILIKYKRASEPLIILAAGILGFFIKMYQ